MSYPDKPPPAGFRLQPEVAADFPTVSRDGKDVHLPAAQRLPVQRRQSGASERIRPGDQPRACARDELAGAPVRPRHRRRRAGRRRQGVDGVRRRRAREHARRPAHAAGAGLPQPDGVDVLLRRASDTADRPGGRRIVPAAGPYTVVDYRRGERVVLRRNRFYGGARPHHVDGFDVDLRAPSPQDVLRQVDRGEADWGHTLSGIYFDPALGLVEKYGLNRSQLSLRPGLTLRILAFNSARPLFRDNPRLRKAVNFALDRRALVLVGGQLVSRPTDQYLPPIAVRDSRTRRSTRSSVPTYSARRSSHRGACAAGRPSSTSTAARSRWRSASSCGSSWRRSGSTWRYVASRSTAPPRPTSTSSPHRGSRGTSPSASGHPATSTRTRTSTCSSTVGSSGPRTSPAYASSAYDKQMRQAARLPQGRAPAGRLLDARRPARAGLGTRRRHRRAQRADPRLASASDALSFGQCST